MGLNELIVTRNLTKRFQDLAAVDRLSIQVREGEIFGFLGHNGAGKTTTVRLLNGLLQPDQGEIRIFGLSPQQDGPSIRARIGVLPEVPALEERLTARENLTIFADLYRVNVQLIEERIDGLLKRFDLIDRVDDPVSEYSKGMKQRLALARTLLHDPELLFLDEPTAGLDPVSARDGQDLIAALSRQGKTIFLCTHNLREAQRLCHRVAVLQEGRVIAQGTPEELSRRIRGRAQVKIEVDRAQVWQALDVIHRRDLEAEADGDSGRIKITGLQRNAVPELVEALTASSVAIYQLHPVESTLEDVYFALYEEEGDR